MARTRLSSGIEIEYETRGDPSDPTLLLVSGFNSQLVSWHERLVDLFVAAGFHAVRFDNRDVGLSSDGDEGYTLSDMAEDAIGLLDQLGVERAHVAGKSMGGMIVQLMAVEHPERIASLTSIMSRPGDQTIGAATQEVIDVLLAPPPTSRDEAIEASLAAAVWGSKAHFDPVAVKELAATQYDRAVRPDGARRQMVAIRTTPDWSDGLRTLDVPTLVLHGLDDTLITPEGGVATADLIPGARLELVADMGHDMPEPLWPMFVDVIAGHCRSATSHLTGAD